MTYGPPRLAWMPVFLIPLATHDPHDPGALENHPVVAGQGAPALLNPAPHLQCLLYADVQTRWQGRWERSKPNERSQAFTLSIRVYPGPSPLVPPRPRSEPVPQLL